jgi:hypothetical protein
MRRNRAKYIILIATAALALTSCGEAAADKDGLSKTEAANASGQTVSANIEKNNDSSTANSGLAVVDTKKVTDIFIQEYKADLTGDGKDESIKLYLSGQENDSLDKLEELVKNNARLLKVQVYNADNKLYEQELSFAHAGNGQLSLVKKDGAYYILSSSLYEGQGEGSYSYEVFDFKDGAKNVVDSYAVSFAIDESAVTRAKARGGELAFREDIVPDFKSHIEKWFDEGSDDCVLLVSCDIANDNNGLNPVMVSRGTTQYKPQDYYDGVWDRKDDIS